MCVVNLASSGMIRQTTLVIGVDVSHTVTDYLVYDQLKEPATAVAWTGALLFDSAIFSLTLYKAFMIGRRINLVNVILRDGTLGLVIHYAEDLIIYFRHYVLLVRAFLFLAVKKKLNGFEQGTFPLEFWEYHDSSSALRLVSTNF